MFISVSTICRPFVRKHKRMKELEKKQTYHVPSILLKTPLTSQNGANKDKGNRLPTTKTATYRSFLSTQAKSHFKQRKNTEACHLHAKKGLKNLRKKNHFAYFCRHHPNLSSCNETIQRLVVCKQKRIK